MKEHVDRRRSPGWCFEEWGLHCLVVRELGFFPAEDGEEEGFSFVRSLARSPKEGRKEGRKEGKKTKKRRMNWIGDFFFL